METTKVPDERLAAVDSSSWLETHSEPFVLIDAEYTIVAANQAYAAAYGARQDQVVGRKCHQVSHRSAEPCHYHGENCPHRSVFATGRPTQVVHVHFDARGQAERVRLTAKPMALADGSILMSESVERIDSMEADGDGEMIGATPRFNHLLAQLLDAAACDLPLLLTGETGTGKGMAAHFVHTRSPRCRGPFITIDCTSIPDSLFESELFGHEKGAFTGPSSRRIGLVEAADGGTLFLDEIGDLPASTQAKLLRVVETGEYRRLGSNALQRIDCRIIAATHRRLHDAPAMPDFRRDLYYRLAGIEVHVPSLDERRADVPRIAAAMLLGHARRTSCRGLSDAARSALLGLDFPGNVRELRHLVHRAAQRAGDAWIEPEHLGIGNGHGADAVTSVREPAYPSAGRAESTPVTQTETAARTRAESVPIAGTRRDLSGKISSLCNCGLSRRNVAEQLGISERTVYRHLARGGFPRIEPTDGSAPEVRVVPSEQ